MSGAQYLLTGLSIGSVVLAFSAFVPAARALEYAPDCNTSTYQLPANWGATLRNKLDTDPLYSGLSLATDNLSIAIARPTGSQAYRFDFIVANTYTPGSDAVLRVATNSNYGTQVGLQQYAGNSSWPVLVITYNAASNTWTTSRYNTINVTNSYTCLTVNGRTFDQRSNITYAVANYTKVNPGTTNLGFADFPVVTGSTGGTSEPTPVNVTVDGGLSYVEAKNIVMKSAAAVLTFVIAWWFVQQFRWRER